MIEEITEKAGDKVTCPKSPSRPGTQPVSSLPFLTGHILYHLWLNFFSASSLQL